MGEQREIKEYCDLLDNDGHLINPGYAVRPFWRYQRSRIRAPWHRIKEWDYYAVLSQDRGYGITFTLADLSYAGIAAVCWLDFNEGKSSQLDAMTLLPRGKMGLPRGSDAGEARFTSKKLNISFDVSTGRRIIAFDAPAFSGPDGQTGLKGELILEQPEDLDSMVIATPWQENPRAFYYNRKINCMPARGRVSMGGSTFDFSPETDFGTLDWGRGNWTYKNRWYWGSASGLLDGQPLGWNLGYGFSDRSSATENMVFYCNRAHKLDEVTFLFDPDDYMAPWQFHASDGRFEMDFIPLVDRYSAFDVKLVKSIQHQVFGHFTGVILLDDGTRLEVRDFLGFAEDVLNWW